MDIMNVKFSPFQFIEIVVRRNGYYLISDQTLLEINEGFKGEYKGKAIKINPCYDKLVRWLETGFIIKESPFTDHKLIVSIR